MEIEVTGAPAHTRTLVVSVAQATAGEIEASGTLLDLRKRGLVPMAADLQTAGVVHDMRVRARIATLPPRLLSIAAEQPSVAFEPSPATGGECCRDPAQRVEALADTPLDPDATRRLAAALGGPRGCSHVLTLAQLLVSSARTALALEGERHAGISRPRGQRLFHRSVSIDGMQSRDRLQLALQLADVHFTPLAPVPGGDPLGRLAGRLEVRVQAEIDLDAMRLRSLRAAERTGGRDAFYGAWRDRSDRLADLAGRSALGGMAGALFERLGADPSDRPLLDALLNLAPALIQCVPAVIERWQDGGPAAARPTMMAGGGMVDSCYMWRRGGALLERFEQTPPEHRPIRGPAGSR
jgi:hypothetical protein